MSQGDQRSAVRPRSVFFFLIVTAAFVASTQPASAACYRLLQPNGWGYQTVCTHSGGGGGGGGGTNYGAALGAGAAFLGALQDLINESPQGSPAPSQSSCRAGYREISGGGCAPSGAVDCGGGRYCPSGNICVAGNQCRTPASIEDDRQFKLKREKAEQEKRDAALADRQFKLEWERAQQDKQNASLAELDEIRRRLARPQVDQTGEPAKPSVALLPPQQTNPFATSRSGASAARAEAASTARAPWSGEAKDCAKAGALEKTTAAWFWMCGPKPPEKRASGYVPSIDPQKLTLRAKAACGSVPVQDQHSCVMNEKLRILLSDDAVVRGKCSSLEGRELVTCVDLTYLYGPDGPSRAEAHVILRSNISQKLMKVPSGAEPVKTGDDGLVAVSAPPSECMPGFGMKPTPGAFGAWSCQKLGVIFLAPDRKTPIDAGSPEGIESVRQFEERIDEVAAAATAAAVRAVGGSLNEEDRKICAVASFGAARGALKGGAPDVPDRCREMALAAQIALAHYADADNRVNTLNAGVEDLLTAYIDGANAVAVDAQKPALVGLDPTREMRQEADCMLRGQSADCASAPDAGAPAPPPARAADSSCVQAESHWKTVEEIRTLELYQDHLARFPSCAFATLAAARIEQLGKK